MGTEKSVQKSYCNGGVRQQVFYEDDKAVEALGWVKAGTYVFDSPTDVKEILTVTDGELTIRFSSPEGKIISERTYRSGERCVIEKGSWVTFIVTSKSATYHIAYG